MSKIEYKDLEMITLSIANVSLLYNLNQNNLLKSNYYNKFKHNVLGYEALDDVGLGNKSMIMMMLYELLGITYEMHLKGIFSKEIIKTINNVIEDSCNPKVENKTNDDVDYIFNIRNAISHYNIDFITENNLRYVVFTDYKPHKNNKYIRLQIEIRRIDVLIKLMLSILADEVNNNR